RSIMKMVSGGINCYSCDYDYTEGYWLEIEGEEPIFYCKECAARANLIGQPGVYEHTEEEEEEEVTWTEIMNKAWHLALNSGTFTDDPEEKAGDVYLVKDIKLVVDAFAKDIEKGSLAAIVSLQS